MPFIDREEELRFLEEQYASRDAALVVVYGRRRLGKTTLLERFLQEKPAIYFLASEEAERENLEEFKRLVAEFIKNPLLEKAGNLAWLDVFRELVNAGGEQRIVVVMDEFQYLCMSNAAYASVFQKIWDTLLKRHNVMVVLCGSLVSMMESQTLSYSSPLYGRRTGQIRLGQIPFRFYSAFYPQLEPDELVQFYAVTGGVPRYIEAFQGIRDLHAAIERNLLRSESFLYEEPMFLLEKEVSEVGSYFSILKAIAAGNHKLSAIAARLEVNQTKLTRYLAVLRQLDLVERRVPVTEDNPEKSKKGLYFIKDNFIAFWFRFVYPYRSYIEIGNPQTAMNAIKEKFVQSHAAYVFERVCRERLWQYSSDGTLPIQFNRAGAWWSARQEIDIVALHEENSEIVFCECKYHEQPIGLRVLRDLQEKAAQVPWRKGARREYFVLFSRNGYENALRQVAESAGDVWLF